MTLPAVPVAMRWRTWLAAVLAAPGLAAGHGAEASAPVVDPAVATVASAHWPGGAPGLARVVVAERGYDHVSSEVHAQWLEPADDHDAGLRIASSRELVPAGLHHIDRATLIDVGDALHVALAGRRTYEPDIAVHCIFELTSAGGIRTLDPCDDR